MREHRKIVGFLLVIAAFSVSAVAFPHLTARVPMHWGLSGTPNRFGGRAEGALTIPGIMAGLWLLFAFVPRYDRLLFIRYGATDSDESTARPIYDLVVVILLALLLAIHTFAMASALGIIEGARQPLLIAIIASLGAISVGNYMPRVTRRNAFIGFRLPWAYASEEVWRRTQRGRGYGMVAGGAIGLVGAVAVPNAPLKPFIVAMIAQSVIVGIYSYYLAHSRTGR